MKKMIKQMMGILLTVALLLTNVPSSALAFEKEMTSIYAIAGRTVMEGTNGYWANENTAEEYYHYYEDGFDSQITIVYSDGSSFSGNMYEISDKTGMWPYHFSNQSYKDAWGVGTHTVTVAIGEISCEMEVEIVENPIESISARATSTVIEGTNGYINYKITNEEYYHYYEDRFDAEITVNYKDSSSFVGTAYDIEEELGISPFFSSNQYQEPWGIGKHIVTVKIGQNSCEMEVEIVDNPIESISAVARNTIFEGTNGYWENEDTDEEYYHYKESSVDAEITVL